MHALPLSKPFPRLSSPLPSPSPLHPPLPPPLRSSLHSRSNDIDEEFRHVQSRLKQSSADLLVVQVKARYPHKPDAFLRDVVSRRLQDGEPMTEDEVNGIVTYMYNEHDADAILGQLHDIRCGKGVCVRPCVLACACVRVRACVRVSVFLCTCVHKGGGRGRRQG